MAFVQAIVTELDDPCRDQVENIWGELKAVFGLQSVIGSTHPHVTYHVAESYEPVRIDSALASVAATTPRFDIETHGLGVFGGDESVLYLHITKSDALVALHQRLTDAIGSLAAAARDIYAPDTWIPHITLAIGDLREADIPQILAFLNRRTYRWRIPVTNVSLVTDTSSAAAPWRRFDLGR